MARSINGMAERFRVALEGPEPIELPGCYDVLSALIIEKAGFKSVFLSGYGVAASLFGNPDIGLTSLPETALLTKNVSNAVTIPVVVDADNGYGNEDNVIRTVYELEYAGAAAMIMEDQVFPKRCGHTSDKKIVPLDHYLKKLDCALKARQTPLVVIARTDAMEIDVAIERAKAFHYAGADVTLVDGLRSLEDATRVAEEVPGPKQINLIYGGKTPLLPLSELGALGFNIVLYSTPALYVVTKALETTMRTLAQSHDLASIGDQSVAFNDFQSLIEEQYLKRAYARHSLTVRPPPPPK